MPNPNTNATAREPRNVRSVIQSLVGIRRGSGGNNGLKLLLALIGACVIAGIVVGVVFGLKKSG